MNIDIETDIELRLSTIKELIEHLFVIDEKEHNKMMNPSKKNIGFTIPQRIALENCLEDIFNDSDNFLNITNYRKEVYEFRMGQMEGTISLEEFEAKMIELETKYPFSNEENIQDEDVIAKIDLRFKKINKCLYEAEEKLFSMIKDNQFNLQNLLEIFNLHILNHFNFD